MLHFSDLTQKVEEIQRATVDFWLGKQLFRAAELHLSVTEGGLSLTSRLLKCLQSDS